jgi:hypothetical protein
VFVRKAFHSNNSEELISQSVETDIIKIEQYMTEVDNHDDADHVDGMRLCL